MTKHHSTRLSNNIGNAQIYLRVSGKALFMDQYITLNYHLGQLVLGIGLGSIKVVIGYESL